MKADLRTYRAFVTHMQSPVTQAELHARHVALRAAMQADDIAALLLTSPADVFYATGFLTRFWESPTRPWFVVLPAAGTPVAIIPAIGAPLMDRTWPFDVHTWDAPDPADDGVSLLTAALQQLVPAQERIGLPMGLETQLRMPLADYARVTEALAPRRFVDATRTVQSVREVKSPAEIEAIRTTCAIADAAFDRVDEIVRSAPRLDAVFRNFQRALLEDGADWVSYVAGAAGQGGYLDVISPATPQPLAQGDVLMLDTGAVRQGYFCDFNRNYAIGTPAPDTVRAHEALWTATERVLSDLKPGHLACDVNRMLSEALARSGHETAGGRLGHGLGLTLTEWPSFTDSDRSVLREGMVLTLEPTAMIDETRMLVHEENIVLRADGAELLSKRAPRALPVIDL